MKQRTEAPTPEEVEAALTRAQGLPRIEFEDIRRNESSRPPQFGNNFFLLFMALRSTNPEALKPLKDRFLPQTEALGEPWKQFLTDNAHLLAQFDHALHEVSIYLDLKRIYQNLLRAGKFDEAEALDSGVHPQLGIEVIGIPVWRQLNALLEQAANAMRAVGIDPLQFYG